MLREIRICSSFLAAAMLLAATSLEADAELKHRYSFTSDANDSVGTAHGTVIDPGATTVTFVGGQLNLTANNGETSAAIAEDAYVDLPNGIVSALGTAGTFETWVTVETNRTWSEIFSFGASREDVGGEDISAGNGKYVTLIPNSGSNTIFLTAIQFPDGSPSYAPFGITEISTPGGAVLSPGVKHHLVGTFDNTDTMGGTNPNGTMRLYLDGSLVNALPLYNPNTLGTLPDVNNWLGRSQWNDPLFDGSYDEFRIYDNGLSADQIALNTIVGPDQFAEAPAEGIFSLIVDTTSGAVTLKNNVNVPVPINYYEITSAGGALNPGSWDSLDDKESGDPAGQGWDQSGGTNANQLIELFLAAAGDTIAANEEITLGNAFNPATFGSGNPGDLSFKFGFTTGALLTGGVTYMSSPSGGDFDGDGDVDGRDFLVWQRNSSIGSLADWKTNYGTGSLAAVAVPEPTVIALVTAVGLIVPLWRSRLNMARRHDDRDI